MEGLGGRPASASTSGSDDGERASLLSSAAGAAGYLSDDGTTPLVSKASCPRSASSPLLHPAGRPAQRGQRARLLPPPPLPAAGPPTARGPAASQAQPSRRARFMGALWLTARFMLANWSKFVVLGVIITLIVLVSVKVGGWRARPPPAALGRRPVKWPGVRRPYTRPAPSSGDRVGSAPTSSATAPPALPQHSALPSPAPASTVSPPRLHRAPPLAGLLHLWLHPALVPGAQQLGGVGHLRGHVLRRRRALPARSGLHHGRRLCLRVRGEGRGGQTVLLMVLRVQYLF